MPPLIVTLLLDPDSQARFEALRQAHFPPARNIVPAHVSLFHALPGEAEAEILARLREIVPPPFPVEVTGLRFLGAGVAYRLASPGLLALRAGLAAGWVDWLTPQDRAPFQPHVTVQNKAAPAAARALHARLAAEFVPWAACGEAVCVWRYLGGPWSLVSEIRA